ncbi:hypothetical protein SAMN05216219_1165 [Mycetocola miduiensis]|uniref:Uncharacterized protein n=1 Tax=Mycetocola miduiensis TaxID=995034 RepID=A0A1I4ZY05_9MICO|nr:hypothetical protein SAMN05216219_1165 [Mycetocola miduiensis]
MVLRSHADEHPLTTVGNRHAVGLVLRIYHAIAGGMPSVALVLQIFRQAETAGTRSVGQPVSIQAISAYNGTTTSAALDQGAVANPDLAAPNRTPAVAAGPAQSIRSPSRCPDLGTAPAEMSFLLPRVQCGGHSRGAPPRRTDIVGRLQHSQRRPKPSPSQSDFPPVQGESVGLRPDSGSGRSCLTPNRASVDFTERVIDTSPHRRIGRRRKCPQGPTSCRCGSRSDRLCFMSRVSAAATAGHA